MCSPAASICILGRSPRSPYEAEFVKFALSDAGQSIVKQVGFVALSLDAPQPPSPLNPDDPRAVLRRPGSV